MTVTCHCVEMLKAAADAERFIQATLKKLGVPFESSYGEGWIDSAAVLLTKLQAENERNFGEMAQAIAASFGITKPCDKFVPYKNKPGVCQKCGATDSVHGPPQS